MHSSELCAAVTSFVSSMLVGSTDSSGDGGSEMASSLSELSEHVYPLIYELHKNSPEFLLRILPNVFIEIIE